MADHELLNDEGMREYIRSGYVTVDADMPTDFHEAIRKRTAEAIEECGGNPGNNILPMVPDLQQVLDHPRVTGALTSFLGPGYHLHAHRYCHLRPPKTPAQGLHKDSWSRRHHRTRWCMALYYPQDTTLDMGPTAVVPGSQYYNHAPDAEVGDEIALSGDAGTVTIVHYDLWHRGLENSSDRPRYMHKFLFARMEEPSEPTWSSGDLSWPEDADRRNGLWQSMWHWSAGQSGNGSKGSGAGDLDELAGQLEDENETTRFQAAYRLGAIGEDGVAALARGLESDDEELRRAASYGLAAAEGCAVSALEEAASSERADTRAEAVDTLGNMGLAAAPSAATLGKALKDDDGTVRANAAYALGNIGAAAADAIPALIDGLDDSEEWVVRNSSLTLARLGPLAAEAVPRLARHLNHENRYVQSKTAMALKRIGTDEAYHALIEHLTTARWCPITTKEMPF